MSSFQPAYKIWMQVKRASDLLPPGGSPLNPYISFQLQGSSENVKTKSIKNSTDPVYNDTLSIDGFFIGSDMLHIWVLNKDEDGNEDKVVGYAQLFMNDLQLGSNQNITVDLYKYDEKRKTMSRQSTKGEAGSINIIFHLAKLNDTPFEVNEWSYPLYQAWFDVISASNIPQVQGQPANPYVSVTVSPAANLQVYRTKAKMGITHPLWNERTRLLLDNYQSQTLNITMHSKNNDGEDPVIGQLSIDLSKCTVGPVIDTHVAMQSQTGDSPIVLHLRLQILAKGTDPFDFVRVTEEEEAEAYNEIQLRGINLIMPQPGVEAVDLVAINTKLITTSTITTTTTTTTTTTAMVFDDATIMDMIKAEQETSSREAEILLRSVNSYDHCNFDWEALSSTFSTSFTGYSQKGHSISGPHPSDENNTWHYHEVIIRDKVRKPKKIENIKLTLAGLDDIPMDAEDATLEITAQLLSLTKPKGQAYRVVLDGSSENANVFEFKKVKPGYSVEILIYQKAGGETKLIAGQRLRVKKMKFDEDDIQQVKLLTPEQLKNSEDYNKRGTAGRIVLLFEHEVNYR
ncbi:hypothetical protein TRFO_06951 [Tritrichomonas foetus]|uniref:C2 domain-containing protein n=1 Tax=Tritrichomonas foetus TaxID=1144522 RepID=A0A1J4JUR7_9EUKA|nr:hypothetical protein TRFO_06951 [Tritrichomonas foetus]|eukprot:OHT02895.1 hypothetical protein TRFO_06951 [Tritrichomonas foetus]